MAGIIDSFRGGLAAAAGARQGAAVSEAQIMQNNQRNALAEFASDPANMAALLNGEQNALASFAAITGDPGKALTLQDKMLGIEGARLSNQATQQSMDLQRQRFEAEVKANAAKMTAEQRKASADKTRQAVQAGMTVQTPAEWDALAMRMGQPDLVGQFEYREGLLATYLDAADILERYDEQNAPYEPQSPEGRLQADINAGAIASDSPLLGKDPSDEYGRYVQEEVAAGRKPLSRIDYAQAKRGQETIYDGEGNIIVQRGNAGPPKMTVDAAKNSGFLIRTEAANEILNSLEGQGTRWGQQQLENVPLGLGNFARDPEFQKFDQARRDFVNAILRRESGAVISDQEFDNADKQYFPMPGDGPEVIVQKRANREAAIEGLRLGSGPGADYIDQQKNQKPVEPETVELPKIFLEGVGTDIPAQEVWDAMTPDQRALFQ